MIEYSEGYREAARQKLKKLEESFDDEALRFAKQVALAMAQGATHQGWGK